MILTPEQNDDLNTIAKFHEQNERLAWIRKRKKIEALIDENIAPLEEKLLELNAAKQAYLDEVLALREVMVKDCVHLPEFLIHKGNYVECKFCDRKISVNKPVSLLAPPNKP